MSSSGTRAGISLQPTKKTVVMQVIPLKHMEDCAGAHSHAVAHGRPHWTRQMCPEGRCSPWRFHLGTGSWQELLSVERSHAGTGFLARLAIPWGTHTETDCFWRTMPSGKDPCWSSWRTVSLGKDPMIGQRRSVRRKEEWWSVINWIKSPFSLHCLKGSR